MREWNCTKIFLATEDREIFEPLKNFFGDNLLSIEKKYVDYSEQETVTTAWLHFDRANDFYLRGKEYLTEISLVAKCNSLVAARCNGSTAALMLNLDGFENVHIFNLGRYGVVNLEDFI